MIAGEIVHKTSNEGGWLFGHEELRAQDSRVKAVKYVVLNFRFESLSSVVLLETQRINPVLRYNRMICRVDILQCLIASDV